MLARSTVGPLCLLAMALVWHDPGRASAAPAATDQRLDRALEQAQAKFKERDFAGAIAGFSDAIALQPADPLLYVRRGIAHASQRDYGKATADLNEAIRLNPKSHDAYAMRCFLWIETGDWEKAIADGAKAIELDPDSIFGYLARGDARRALDDFDGAVADFDRAVALAPGYGMLYMGRGRAKVAQGDRQGGLADLDAAVKADPVPVEPWFWRGIAFYDLRDWAHALDDFRCANGIGGFEWSLLRTWVVRARLGERDAATGELRAGLKVARARLRPGCNVSTDWAHEIGRFLLSEVTEANLLAAAVGATKAATANKTIEASYFAAMRRLLDGDKAGAIALLRRALRTDSRSYSEYGSSFVELQELLLGVQLAPRAGQGPAPRRAAGLCVTRILDGGPAQVAGLKEGDILTTLGGKGAALADLRRLLIEAQRGSRLSLEFLRGEQKATGSLTVGP